MSSARGAVLAAVTAASACAHPHGPPAATPPPGIAIALYADHAGHTLAVIDDRRWVDVVAARLVLPDLEPGVALPSLVIEGLAGPGPLALGTCARDRLDPGAGAGAGSDPSSGLGANAVPPPPPPPPPRVFGGARSRETTVSSEIVLVGGDPAPALDLVLGSTLHCAVTAPAGRYLVRLVYSSTTLGYHAEHEVTLAHADRAHVVSHLAITTPAWRPRDGAPLAATITAFDGLPGGAAAPVELAHGRVVLDGSTGTLGLPVRDVPARIRRVLTASEDLTAPDDPTSTWMDARRNSNGDETDALVWVWLELPGTQLAPGLVQVRVEYPGEAEHDVVVTADSRSPAEETAAVMRLPLWADDELRASLSRAFGGAGETELLERFGATVMNVGETTREVFVEEKLRAGGKRSVSQAFPTKPGLAGDVLRVKVVVAPRGQEKIGFVVRYKD